MKLKKIKSLLSLLLVGIMISSMALQVAAANTSTTSKEIEYLYGVVDMNYADFYYGELEDIEPDGKTTVTPVSEDLVTKAGYRDEGMYDAATFATPKAFDYLSKWANWPGTYSEAITDEDGVVQGGKILGVAEVNVAISKDLYEAALKDSSATVLQSKIAEIQFNEDQSIVPASYKVLNSDGVYSKYINVTEPTSSVLTGSIHTNYMGDDNWWEGSGMTTGEGQTLLGGFVEWTEDPTDANSTRYIAGLKHEENLWTDAWIGWGVGPNAQGIYGGNEVGWQRFEGISGKYVTKLVYILLNEDGSVTYHTGISEEGMISPILLNGVADEDGNYPYDVKIVSHKYTKDRLILDITYDVPVGEDGNPEAEVSIYRFNIPSTVTTNPAKTSISLPLTEDDKQYVPVYEESEWVNGHKDVHIEIDRSIIGTGRLKYWTKTENVQEGGREFSTIARWYNLTTDLTSKEVYIQNNQLCIDSELFTTQDYRINSYQKIVVQDADGEEHVFETGDSNGKNGLLTAILDENGNFNMDAVYTYTTGRGENVVTHNDPVFTKGADATYQVTIYSGGFPIVQGVLNQPTISVDSSIQKTYGDKAFDLQAKLTGNGLLTYESDNTKVVTVSDEGIVTVVGAGTANVTVSALSSKEANFTAAKKTVKITVNKANQSVTVQDVKKTYGDKKFALGAKSNGDGTLSYTSSNTKVATVAKDGTVTIKGAGTAKITVTAKATDNYKQATATATVTVAKTKQSVTVQNVKKTYGDKKFALGAKSNGDGTLSYASSNTKVATIAKDGTVTIKGAGTAKITVTAKATDNYNQATATATVTVAKAKQTITAQSVSKVYGAKAFSIGAKALGSAKLSYKSSDTKVATVDKSGKVSLKGTGTATITITAAATDNYKTATKNVTVKVSPAKLTLKSAVSKKAKTVEVTWKKDAKATGYIVEYATNKNFKNAKSVTIKKNSTVNTSLKNLTSKKTYYIRVCAYTASGKTTIKGAYSAIKSVTVK